MTHLLPEDKSTQLIFYCGGLKCPLSHKSAAKAEALGYTNIGVYAAGYPDWVKQGHTPGVSAAYVKKMIDKKADAVIVDARPARKFKKSHVPTAINISNTKFDDNLDLLPKDKATELIYYCGGYKCPLSTKSAAKAVAKGYTNVKLFQAGYPAWKEAYGAEVAEKSAATGSAAPRWKPVKNPESSPSLLLTSRLRRTLTIFTGMTCAIRRKWKPVVPLPRLHRWRWMIWKIISIELPTDKPIVFFCSTGARAGEAYDIVKMKRDELKVYFLDANVKFHKDGSIPTASPPD